MSVCRSWMHSGTAYLCVQCALKAYQIKWKAIVWSWRLNGETFYRALSSSKSTCFHIIRSLFANIFTYYCNKYLFVLSLQCIEIVFWIFLAIIHCFYEFPRVSSHFTPELYVLLYLAVKYFSTYIAQTVCC